MSRDILSDVLRSVRMRSAVFFLVSGEGSWTAEAPASKDIAAVVMPGAGHVIEYHVVTAGECWAVVTGEPRAACARVMSSCCRKAMPMPSPATRRCAVCRTTDSSSAWCAIEGRFACTARTRSKR